MLTDTSGIRHLARQLRERAQEIRAEGARLQRLGDGIPWRGRAADAMRAQLAVRLATLGACAGLHDDAAEALERHAGAVDAVVAVGGAVTDTVGDLVHDARSLL
ncbi:putative T7SS-secreted protein [Nocardioides sp. URHA0020]|uniref:putative T7SS-secreted protein n=1 Tax=Nocardioides sp. URHA0020 TaxID=1380392 RepID=UPI000684BC66|nr:hypothetical protein [Nocardioides sp. URHA0020]